VKTSERFLAIGYGVWLRVGYSTGWYATAEVFGGLPGRGGFVPGPGVAANLTACFLTFLPTMTSALSCCLRMRAILNSRLE